MPLKHEGNRLQVGDYHTQKANNSSCSVLQSVRYLSRVVYKYDIASLERIKPYPNIYTSVDCLRNEDAANDWAWVTRMLLHWQCLRLRSVNLLLSTKMSLQSVDISYVLPSWSGLYLMSRIIADQFEDLRLPLRILHQVSLISARYLHWLNFFSCPLDGTSLRLKCNWKI